jgi:hypothetical protein
MEVFMPAHQTAEEKKVVDLINRLPFAPEDRQTWLEILTTSGLNEELAKEIHSKAVGLPQSDPEHTAKLTQNVTNLNMQINRWRLTNNLRHTGKR